MAGIPAVFWLGFFYMMDRHEPEPKQLVAGVCVLGALIAALLCWVIADSRAALSAALGGGISSAASLVMALLSFGNGASKDPLRAIRAFFVGEAAKVIVVIVLFVVVLKTMKVVPLAMLGAYIATFFVFWVALGDSRQQVTPRSKQADGMRR